MMDKWVVYEMLKGGREQTIGEVINKLNKVNEEDMREAIIEFIISRMREER
ncbi:MAG: hypothetical protein JG776_481 [Caloramator sp.]|jgi:hypothetical protein|uniref:hypothetical protein n=1 Tax=Caloramator sp. TaxID=1871330 RepID=UPI001DF9FF39|nr:hypothetical protein [Caloramator sp.]MBZ4662799.1 hypothetical protein [Caloramator sp.]